MEKGEIEPKYLPVPTLEQISGLLALVNTLRLTKPLDRPRALVNGIMHIAAVDYAGVWVQTSPDHFETVALTSGGASAGIAIDATKFIEPQRSLRTRSPIVLCRPEPARRSLISLCCGSSDHTSILGIWRERTGFEDQHRSLLHLIHPHVHWVLEKEQNAPAALPMRTRNVLELTLTGMSEKEIAKRLGRSVHTVHSHIKRVYRHYDVRSRSELMLKFFDRQLDVPSRKPQTTPD